MSQNKRVLIIILCAALAMTGCQKSSNEETSDILKEQTIGSEQADFKTTTVTKEDFTTETSMKGTVTYFNSTALSFDETVVFTQFLIEEGQQVKQGEPLAECEMGASEKMITQLQLQIDTLTTELTSLEKKYEEDSKQLQTYQNESQGNEQHLYTLLITKKQQQYEHDRQQKSNELAALETELKQYKEAEENCYIYAKSDGIIDKLAYVSAGEEVEADRWMIKMHDQSVSYIQVTDDKETLDYNMEVTVQADNDGRQTYTGKVVCADQILNSELKTGYAYIQLTEDDVNLADLSNITVTAVLQNLSDVLVVDRSAVYTSGGKKYVLIYEDGVIKKRYVTIGLEGTDKIYLLDGVSEGQQVIIET